eukprot:CAMPEP_0195508846 /NCGR_PEP_ID=MMETSP0794_2-20130614/1947_1 /TAXON_ID=515487 /ORGANISM="Stephanopyxis turris, Strain CCMP 815" /LENGTH=291 /DNA_ID=CAMNT_0040635921 /DNA_START=119 /DNA_END=991 /DNA_ORIENTATION=-
MSIEEKIPATVHMISGCQDSQTSADVSNVAAFRLPDPQGRAGGACTAAILKTLYAEEQAPTNDLSYVEVLMSMRETLSQGDYTQIPQLTSSRPMDVNTPFTLVPEECTGTKRALLIGINYVGQNGELSGCHNDVYNMKNYIMNVWGFEEENIKILLDDGEHADPTRDNILNGYKTLVNESESGDAVFCHYSGHGGRLRDNDGDEEDGYDETLVPLDYGSAGQIRDDDLFKVLVGAMPRGVNLTCLMDCCHSGTVLDLPYKFKADGESDEMQLDEGFDMDALPTGGAVAGGW